jgi:hypothetical protein
MLVTAALPDDVAIGRLVLVAPAISPDGRSSDDIFVGHAGNHLADLNGRWQTAKLLPALDSSVDLKALRARWARTCKES